MLVYKNPKAFWEEISPYLKREEIQNSFFLGVSFGFLSNPEHRKTWETETAAGLKMPETDTEIVLNTDLPQEADLLVESVREAHNFLIAAGCKSLRAPFETKIGMCAVVLDPFGNQLAFLDLSKVRKS